MLSSFDKIVRKLAIMEPELQVVELRNWAIITKHKSLDG